MYNNIYHLSDSQSAGCVCQVFYHKKGLNHWTVTLAFCQKSKFDVRKLFVHKHRVVKCYLCLFKQKMKGFYQDADIGPSIDVKFKATSQLAPNIRKVIGGWTLVPDNQLKQV